MADELVVYGSDWCGYTQRCLRKLDSLGVTYRYVEIEQSPGAEEKLSEWSHGNAIRPALDMNGDIFVNPNTTVLEAELRNHGYLV